MKNLVVINSTYRKGGNSEVLATEFARGAIEAGNSVRVINLRDIRLNYCIGCMSCSKTGKCIQNDGMNKLLSVVRNADVIAFATPVYFYSVSGQLKTFLDRTDPLFAKENKFRQIYLLATAAESEKSALDGAIKAVQGWIDCFDDVSLAGVIYGLGAEKIGDIRGIDAPRLAYEAGKNI